MPNAHVGMEPTGTVTGQQGPKNGAPGVTHYEDLLAVEAIPQKGNHLLGIAQHEIYQGGARNSIRPRGDSRLAAPSLIPLHDHKVVLPRILVQPAHRHFRTARTAMNEQKYRVARILAPDGNPLVNTTNRDFDEFFHAIRSSDASRIAEDFDEFGSGPAGGDFVHRASRAAATVAR